MSGSARTDDLDLAGFPAGTLADWRVRVAAVLRKRGETPGPAPEDALDHSTYDGIRIRPLYTSADLPQQPLSLAPGSTPSATGAAGGWDVRVRLAGADVAQLNATALAELGNGASSLWLRLGEGGLAVSDLPAALEQVALSDVPIALDAGAQALPAAAALLDLAAHHGAQLSGTLGADPIGCRARTGADADPQTLAALAGAAAAQPKLALATVDATIYHDAGASDGQELAIATAVGVAYLRSLTAAGMSTERALAAIEFRFAVTDDQFAGIAKLRAARRMWDRVGELCRSTGRHPQRQHAVTSAAMLTRRAPWVNMPRAGIACVAAAVGGADAITVLPFDHAIGPSDDFARRIARNTSGILRDESGLAHVADAAGGSWFVESLSAQLADRAWALFTEIERAGGALSALESGHIAERIGAVRDRRAAQIAHRIVPITGVSEFAYLGEEPVHRTAASTAPAEPRGQLPSVRYAAAFEALRERADSFSTGPRVFLAALGEYSAHADAVSFATNLFHAGGIEAVTATGAPDELVAAWQRSGTVTACLCASDEAHATDAVADAAALKAAGVRLLWLVGELGTRLGPDLGAGVDGYLYPGCDAIEVLGRTLDAIGADL